MPIYEYLCTSCGHRFEKLQDMNDTSAVVCPKCGKTTERIIPTRTGVVMGSKGKSCCGKEESCNDMPCAGTGGCCKR